APIPVIAEQNQSRIADKAAIPCLRLGKLLLRKKSCPFGERSEKERRRRGEKGRPIPSGGINVRSRR
ncbi:MAG: hypothetical protein JW759_05965, partial [Candidatus Coatesbacteria bacterium]|nr:hypothetical protein [Candidatus Coatesbacteria bacterium]